MDIIKKIVSDLGFKKNQVEVVLQLLEEGNTIPFIARYRKEMTGGLDEVEILSIQETYDYEKRLEERKLVVIEKIKFREKLTKPLENKILSCTKLKEVEDLYRPYIEKKNSKAEDARKKGLNDIAEKVITFDINFDLEKTIKEEVKRNKKVKSSEEVVAGIKEIVKEKIVENVEIREDVRKEYSEKSFIVSKVKDELKDVNGTFKVYYDYKEEVKKVPSHRLLAMKRGESEGILKLSYDVEKETILKKIKERFVGGKRTSIEEFIEDVVKESYSKSLKVSIEREITSELKENSDFKAIDVFKKNLEDLLLTSPIKGRVILGLDPAFRTGCKLSVIDKNGTFLEKGLIYPHAPVNKVSESKEKLKAMLNKHNVTLVAIGNGTASRESEQFVVEVFKEMEKESSNKIQYVIVNEAGASVYSASEVAREEFPHFSVEERSAVSIARRVLDPLAELVKIDPKSIGIGQYQHDVDKRELDKALNFTIEKVVNRVGINVNTASVELLSHVAGLNKKIASNIIDYRNKNGSFNSRLELKKVKGLGPKAYEQAIGFLRIYDGANKLDETGIHPESYAVATKLVTDMGYNLKDIGTDSLSNLSSTIKKFNDYSESDIRSKIGVGKSTVIDILHELQKPRRDIREETGEILLRSDILKIDDLHVGLELKGTIRNVVDFGAFVDIGLKGDGLVHISKMVNRFIKHPSEIVSVGDVVTVWVDSVDLDRGKVSLRMV